MKTSSGLRSPSWRDCLENWVHFVFVGHKWRTVGVGAQVFQLRTHLEPDVLWGIWKTPFSQPCVRESQLIACSSCSLPTAPRAGTAVGASPAQTGPRWALPGLQLLTMSCCELPSLPDAVAELQVLQNPRVPELQPALPPALPAPCHPVPVCSPVTAPTKRLSRPQTQDLQWGQSPMPILQGSTPLEQLLRVRSSAFSCTDSRSCLGQVA